ncbi:MAG: radical SAM protein [Proteobacteria bacterium]|nr:radical SAM protein [Pseudomonadota bacterium]MBU1060404.1 radical SAM protein [Pseudomonadota bacterium]
MPENTRHPAGQPSLVYADLKGNITDFPALHMAGMSGGQFLLPEKEDFIPLPEGSELFVLPGRLPVGLDPDSGEPLLLEDNPFKPGEPIQAVSAFMSPAHTAVLNSAYQTQEKAPRLPLFAYTAVGWYDDRFWTTAFRSDADIRQDAAQFNQTVINSRTRTKLNQYKHNRLVQHLGKCCLTYACPAARNYFLGRWEAPLPTSPTCNARCVGCISLQSSGKCSATQDRIRFVPTPAELAEIAIPHLQHAEQAIVSFGQGCEGEPLLQADTIEKAIAAIRRKTDRGTINLNSNASLPQAIKRLSEAGLDSLRVSINSAQIQYHSDYYRPQNFTLADVLESIQVMKRGGGFVSLNYFILPGVTDSIEEYTALRHLLHTYQPDRIQLRNLNMDPEWYLRSIKFQTTAPALGMRKWLENIKQEFPELQLGYYNPPIR